MAILNKIQADKVVDESFNNLLNQIIKLRMDGFKDEKVVNDFAKQNDSVNLATTHEALRIIRLAYKGELYASKNYISDERREDLTAKGEITDSKINYSMMNIMEDKQNLISLKPFHKKDPERDIFDSDGNHLGKVKNMDHEALLQSISPVRRVFENKGLETKSLDKVENALQALVEKYADKQIA